MTAKSPKRNYQRAIIDLEEPIREADYMVSIAADLLHHLFDSYGEQDGEDELLRMSMRDHDRLLFVVDKAREYAAKANEAFESASRGVAA